MELVWEWESWKVEDILVELADYFSKFLCLTFGGVLYCRQREGDKQWDGGGVPQFDCEHSADELGHFLSRRFNCVQVGHVDLDGSSSKCCAEGIHVVVWVEVREPSSLRICVNFYIFNLADVHSFLFFCFYATV